MTLLWTLVAKLSFLLLSLRYRIDVKGLDCLKRLSKKGGILFLPNHPAHMDPLFLFLLLWPKYRMRPLVIEHIFRIGFLKPLMKLTRALPIPNFGTSVNQLKVKRAQEAIQKIADSLKAGENVILYPSGQLKSGGREILGGASGAHALVQECKEAQIVLIRTSGLWGSNFSRAITGRTPDLGKTLLFGVWTVIKNGIFFCPRRKVEIEITLAPPDLPREGSRVEFNRYLERWYNQYPDGKGGVLEEEPAVRISYAFWKNQLLDLYEPKKREGLNGKAHISPEIRSKIFDEIRRIMDNPGLEISPEMSFAIDLGMDSLNLAEMVAFLAREYDIMEIHPEDLQIVEDALEMAGGARPSTHPVKQINAFRWKEEANRPPPALPVGRTIPEAFLNSCERMGDYTACADDLVGLLSYKKMKRAVIVLASYFKTLPDEKIAVLLPASAGAYIVIVALELAGKVPVMLNWTLGPRYLDEMMRLSGAEKTVTSWRFLERLAHVEFGSLIDKVLLLEDIRKGMKLGMKLKGAFLAMRSPPAVMRAFDLDKIDENDPCVILFTSGTEASPKGVPLSHKNILANQRSAMQCISLDSDTVIYGILPPFHSFGFSVAGLFPLLGGIRTAFYPDPTDSFALAEGVERWKITLFCSAPSFLKGLLHAAKKGQLDTIRLFVSGAEKAPQELYQRVAKLGTNAQLVEGYGITECSPVISLQRFNMPPKGVGRPLPDIEVCTIHLETGVRQPKGAEGEICVRGPNVFNGYLGSPRTPFIEIDGVKWYRTGDIGYLDADDDIILSGRLKRFTKIAGEMISLGAVEEVLMQELLKRGQITADAPALAVCADEKEAGKPHLILFTTVSIDKETANEILKESGLSRLVKISSVQKIEEIPMMGTGKTDYRKLQQSVV